MTNGEKIQNILDIDRDCTEVHGENGTMTFTVTQDFWNAEYKEPTTKNDLGVASELEKNSKKLEKETNYTWEDVSSVMDAMEYRTNSLIENIKSEILHFANAHCSGDDINIYDVFKVIDDCCEAENSATKNDLEVDAVSRKAVINQIFYSTDNNGDVVLGSALWQRIARLPSVTPQERKGHWIYKAFDERTGITNVRICSKCGYPLASPYKSFCSVCGSDNREVEK